MSNFHVFFDDEHARPEKLTEVPHLHLRRTNMVRRLVVDASKSGMGMWLRATSLKSSSYALLADIVCGGSGGSGSGGDMEGGREL